MISGSALTEKGGALHKRKKKLSRSRENPVFWSRNNFVTVVNSKPRMFGTALNEGPDEQYMDLMGKIIYFI